MLSNRISLDQSANGVEAHATIQIQTPNAQYGQHIHCKKYGVKRDRSVKRVKSYSKWSKLLLEVVSFHSISSSFYRAIPFLLHI